MDLYLLKYNNYINRILKLESTLAGYTPYQISKQTATNFWQGDGLNTEFVANYDESQYADYAIEADTDGTIKSRWFIIDKQRTSGGQAKLSLRRDVMAENRTAIKNATGYVYRGYVKQSNNLIFNDEGNSYNQIKQSETLLKDQTSTAWIVGYLADNFTASGDVGISLAANKAYTETYTDAAAVEAAYPGTSLTGAQEVATNLVSPSNMSFEGYESLIGANYYIGTYSFLGGRTSYTASGTSSATHSLQIQAATRQEALSAISANTPSDTTVKAAILSDNPVQDIPYNKIGTVIRVGTSAADYKFYKLTLNGQTSKAITKSATGSMETLIKDVAQAVISAGAGSGSTSAIAPKYTYTQTYRNLEWVNVTVESDATIAGTVTKTSTSPYYMFAVPYDATKFVTGGTTYTSNRDSSLSMVDAIIRQLNAFVYDVQLLPYFPGTEALDGSTINLDNVASDNYTLVTEDGTPKTFLYWCGTTTFRRRISCVIQPESDLKVQNETQFVRLCSPNYASIYEFSAAKNGGVSYFTIDCTYRPWQPYIHVAPNWGGLYGINFDDPRGLICSGDFSLDIATDAWAQYQANNKNYQLMFDRQIQTMDLQHGVQNFNSILSVISSAVAGVPGLMKASNFGSNATLAGEAAGYGLGLIGAGINAYQGYQLRQNERSQAIDMYNYELGNVKARSDTLTKVNAINANNKLFPVVEIHSATVEEITALKNQIKFSGAKVGVVSTLSEFLNDGSNSFIQARLIRINVADEPHVAQAIADELYAGYYWN